MIGFSFAFLGTLYEPCLIGTLGFWTLAGLAVVLGVAGAGTFWRIGGRTGTVNGSYERC